MLQLRTRWEREQYQMRNCFSQNRLSHLETQQKRSATYGGGVRMALSDLDEYCFHSLNAVLRTERQIATVSAQTHETVIPRVQT